MNAVKFSKEGSVIEIDASISLKDKCNVVVRDYGEGIAPVHLSQIFDPHFQVSCSHRDLSRGLGLTYCEKAMEAHGETIDVKSDVGQGTVFTLSFDTQYSVEIKNTKTPIPCQLDTVNFLGSLSTIQKETIRQYATPMKALKVYQVSKIKDILMGINNQSMPYLKDWKSAITMCLEYYDKGNYKSLINL